MPKIRRSYIVAAGVALTAALWLLSSVFSDSAAQRTEAADEAVGEVLPQVRTRISVAQDRVLKTVVRGAIAADRKVMVRAETQGRVYATPVEQGSYVQEGDLLCALSLEARQARRDEAAAMLELRRLELSAAEQLAARGHRARMGLAQAKAAYDAAQAQLEQNEIEITYTQIRAPFEGILDQMQVEVGDYMSPGSACALIIDLDPFVVAGQVSERDVGKVRAGLAGFALLPDGRKIAGKVRYVAAAPDEQTRTFRVEVEVANDGSILREGVTAEIQIPQPAVPAHRIEPAILTLNAEGEIGVRVIEGADTVRFRKVEIAENEGDAFWITGLAPVVQLITVGQEFVADGARVSIDDGGEGLAQGQGDSL